MRYAIVENGIVTNIALADQPMGDDWIEATEAAQIGGTWDGKKFGPAPVDVVAVADAARQERSRLLATSDWTQVADAPVNQAAWAEYRQALRDLPDRLDFPMTIDWPVPPST